MTGDWLWPLLAFAAAAAATALATRLVLAQLRRRAILDLPNERSSHAQPTPRGGGIAILAVLAPGWLLIQLLEPRAEVGDALIVAGLLALAALSWLDDLYDLSAALRVVCHGLVVALALLLLPGDGLVFQGILPPLADRIAAGLLWLWFINLFNFMDGIDGISGVETLSIALGLAVIIAASGEPSLRGEGLLAMTVAGTAFGFLVWNWHPARLFLGDVGSVPLGFVLGWLLIQAALAGHWAAAVILPLYYLADATITLTRRLMRGEKIWRAHREHFYQRAVAQGRGHDTVARAIATANGALIICALTAELAAGPSRILALAVAPAIVAALLVFLASPPRPNPG